MFVPGHSLSLNSVQAQAWADANEAHSNTKAALNESKWVGNEFQVFFCNRSSDPSDGKGSLREGRRLIARRINHRRYFDDAFRAGSTSPVGNFRIADNNSSRMPRDCFKFARQHFASYQISFSITKVPKVVVIDHVGTISQ